MRLQTKLLAAIAAVFAMVFVAVEVMDYRRVRVEAVEAMLDQARTVRGVLMATRRVYHHQFLASGVPLTDETLGFLPAHALKRISDDFANWVDSGLTFNNVSDRPRNPQNAADAVELAAMRFFRENPYEKERMVPFSGGNGAAFFHYSRPIWTESYCLECHGRRQDAPPAIRARYEEGFGYQSGDLRGILSIKLPAAMIEQRVAEVLPKNAVAHFIGLLAAFAVLSWLLRRTVTARIGRLKAASASLAAGDYGARAAISGNDEVADVARAFDAMAGAIAERDARLRTVVDGALDGIIGVDKSARIETISPAAAAMFGYQDTELLGQPIATLVPERFREAHTAGFQRYLKTSESSVIGQVLEVPGRRKDGTEFPTELSVGEVKGADTHRFVAVVKDLSEQRRHLAQIERDHQAQSLVRAVLELSLQPYSLREQLQRALDMVLAAPWYRLLRKGCIFLTETDGGLAMTAQSGLPEALVAACSRVEVGECLCGTVAERGSAVFADCVDERHGVLHRGIAEHGHYCVPIRSHGEVLGVMNLYVERGHGWNEEEEQLLNTVADALAGLIERKRAERETEQRVQQQEAVARLGQYALTAASLDGLFDQATSVVTNTLQVDLCGVFELLPEGDTLLLRAGVGWKADRVGRSAEGKGLDSQAGFTLFSSTPVIVSDLATETRFAGSPLLREHGVVSGISVIVQRGLGPWGALGAHARCQRTFTRNDAHFLQAVANVLGAAIGRVSAEEEARLADERLIAQQRSETERVRQELEKAQAQVVSQTRLAAVGQLASSIAHEMRNPLGAVRNAAFYLKRQLPSDESELAEYLDIIDREVAVSDRVITDLINMSRGGAPEKQTVDVGRSIEAALRRVVRAVGIRHKVSLEPDPFQVEADPRQLQQVLENLFYNAVQAMSGEGELRVEARRSTEWDMIAVEDSGPGIPPEQREAIFEPLYTTKPKGTGLGLTICRQIIERHGGTLEVMDGAGSGARFRIRLPKGTGD